VEPRGPEIIKSKYPLARGCRRIWRGEAARAAWTQQFNTTTSMGRLTLNVLLSFAQFEREVTSERIRDKIAASKRKGLWVGGTLTCSRSNPRSHRRGQEFCRDPTRPSPNTRGSCFQG
jgi:hypothetical protein